MILVADAQNTTRSAMSHVRDQIEQVGGNLIGGILNDFDPARAKYYPAHCRYYYSSKYEYGYGSQEDAPERQRPVREALRALRHPALGAGAATTMPARCGPRVYDRPVPVPVRTPRPRHRSPPRNRPPREPRPARCGPPARGRAARSPHRRRSSPGYLALHLQRGAPQEAGPGRATIGNPAAVGDPVTASSGPRDDS